MVEEKKEVYYLDADGNRTTPEKAERIEIHYLTPGGSVYRVDYYYPSDKKR